MTMCKIHIHILSTHSVLLDILTDINARNAPYVHILHYVHIYTHNNMRRCSRFYIGWIRSVMDVHWMVSSSSRKVVVQCVHVVQLNCVKVQCMAYRKVGVCCRVY